MRSIMPGALALYRRAIRACRAIPVTQVDEKLEYNIKISAHQLFRSTRTVEEAQRRIADGKVRPEVIY